MILTGAAGDFVVARAAEDSIIAVTTDDLDEKSRATVVVARRLNHGLAKRV
jgi:hypothetical protein